MRKGNTNRKAESRVEMMEAAYSSAEAGGTPVELPLYPELEMDTP